jgi:hypothetical protein
MAGDADHPAMPLDDALDYLAQRIALYARCVQGSDRNFLPYPASWLNAGSFWDDERDWSEKPKSGKNAAVHPPPEYVPESEKILRQRAVVAQ